MSHAGAMQGRDDGGFVALRPGFPGAAQRQTAQSDYFAGGQGDLCGGLLFDQRQNARVGQAQGDAVHKGGGADGLQEISSVRRVIACLATARE